MWNFRCSLAACFENAIAWQELVEGDRAGAGTVSWSDRELLVSRAGDFPRASTWVDCAG